LFAEEGRIGRRGGLGGVGGEWGELDGGGGGGGIFEKSDLKKYRKFENPKSIF
jgi:hypothetical protein